MKVTGRTAEYATLGTLIAAVRAEQQMTQRQFAEKLHRPQSAIAKLERGCQGLEILEFLDFAEAVGIAPEQLIRRFMDELRTRHPKSLLSTGPHHFPQTSDGSSVVAL